MCRSAKQVSQELLNPASPSGESWLYCPLCGDSHKVNGAGNWNRTNDLLITNELLYRLSYSGSGYLERAGSLPANPLSRKAFTRKFDP